MESDPARGYKTDASKDICRDGAEKTDLKFNEKGTDGKCCPYDVTFPPSSSSKKNAMFDESNLVQCPEKDGPFYLKKIKEIVENEIHEDDEYEVYIEETYA